MECVRSPAVRSVEHRANRLGNALGLVPCRGIVQPIERKPTDHGDAQAYQCVGPKPQRSNEELRHAVRPPWQGGPMPAR